VLSTNTGKPCAAPTCECSKRLASPSWLPRANPPAPACDCSRLEIG
jgi:hypothetical protein